MITCGNGEGVGGSAVRALALAVLLARDVAVRLAGALGANEKLAGA